MLSDQERIIVRRARWVMLTGLIVGVVYYVIHMCVVHRSSTQDRDMLIYLGLIYGLPIAVFALLPAWFVASGMVESQSSDGNAIRLIFALSPPLVFILVGAAATNDWSEILLFLTPFGPTAGTILYLYLR